MAESLTENPAASSVTVRVVRDSRHQSDRACECCPNRHPKGADRG